MNEARIMSKAEILQSVERVLMPISPPPGEETLEWDLYLDSRHELANALDLLRDFSRFVVCICCGDKLANGGFHRKDCRIAEALK